MLMFPEQLAIIERRERAGVRQTVFRTPRSDFASVIAQTIVAVRLPVRMSSPLLGSKKVDEIDEPRRLRTSFLLETIAGSRVARQAYFLFRHVPVVNRLLHFCLNEAFPTGRRIWFQVPRGHGKGLWILVDPRFDPDYFTGGHEAWVQDLLKKRLKPGECFYDVGAHIGFLSLIAARLVGPTGLVTAFEPDVANLAILRANCGRNEIFHLNIIAAAVWDSSGELAFARGDKASSRMEGRVIDQKDDKSDVVNVTAISLDDFVLKDSRRPPHFLKIDVEGGESRVLLGATQVLKQCRPLLLCEVHDLTRVEELQRFLFRLGYVAAEHPSGGKSYLWAEPRQ